MANFSEPHLSLLLVLGALGLLLMSTIILLIIVFRQNKLISQRLSLQEMQTASQRELLEASIEAQEDERLQIATDLHDEIGTPLYTIRLTLNQAISKLSPNDAAAEYLRQARQMLDDTTQTVRRILRNLNPATLNQFGLVDALEELVGRIEQMTGIKVGFRHEGLQKRLDAKLEITLFRIIQELINNTLKHSLATQIELLVQRKGNLLRLQYQDDGSDAQPDDTNRLAYADQDIGFKKIKSRVSIFGGNIVFPKMEKKGASIQIEMKIN